MKHLFVFLFALALFPFSIGSQNLLTDKTPLFSASGNCTSCHSNMKDTAGNDVSIDSHWRSSMMANAAKDPYFLAKVASEIARFPQLQSVIEDKCSQCHMPMAQTQSSTNGESGVMFGEGYLNENHPLHNVASDGVSCTVCHQIQNDNLGLPESFSGNFSIDLTTPKPGRIAYGPYPGEHKIIMSTVSGFVPEFGEQMQRSELCASCHTLYTPYIDQEGNIAGEFPEQMIYFEWKHSEYGDGTEDDRVCQDCHMPRSDGPVKISLVPSTVEPREPFGQHHFVGGNAYMIELMKNNRQALNLTASESHLEATLQRTLAQLQQNTAALNIESIDVSSERLTADIGISIQTGHKYPAGFPSRRVWIHVKLTDADGTILFESGKPLADGSIQGNDSDAMNGIFENHYDVINSEDEVQIYETILKDTEDKVTHALLSASGYLKDNRLLPRGFDKSTADADFAVYGQAMGDENFIGGSDRVRYSIDIRSLNGPFTLSAELLHQSVAYPFVEDLKEVNQPIVQDFIHMVDASDRTPVVVSSVEQKGIEKPVAVEQWRVYE